MKALWILIILIPIAIVLYLRWKEKRDSKRIQDEWDMKDRIRKVRKEVEEEMKGKSPEEKANLFNEKMKRFKK